MLPPLKSAALGLGQDTALVSGPNSAQNRTWNGEPELHQILLCNGCDSCEPSLKDQSFVFHKWQQIIINELHFTCWLYFKLVFSDILTSGYGYTLSIHTVVQTLGCTDIFHYAGNWVTNCILIFGKHKYKNITKMFPHYKSSWYFKGRTWLHFIKD